MDKLTGIASVLGARLAKLQWRLATAESCTGGGVAEAVTRIPGSSAWFECGFVTYSNHSKKALLGVPDHLLEQYGAVSEAVVLAMVQGAIQRSQAQAALSVSGVAGPQGGTPDKPVGLVWMAWNHPSCSPFARSFHFAGDRQAVRQQAVFKALDCMLESLPPSPLE